MNFVLERLLIILFNMIAIYAIIPMVRKEMGEIFNIWGNEAAKTDALSDLSVRLALEDVHSNGYTSTDGSGSKGGFFSQKNNLASDLRLTGNSAKT